MRRLLAKPNFMPYLLLTLTQAFWAGNWVVGRAIRGEVPPIALGFWRWVLAVALFMPLAWPHLREGWPLVKLHWRKLTLLGALGTGLYNALAYIGLNYTTATNGVLLNSFCPIIIIALAWAFFGKRISPREGLGVSVSLIGVLLIVMRGDPAVLTNFHLNIGDFWVLASVTTWAAYTCLLTGRPVGLNNWVFLVSLATIGLILMFPFYVWEIASGKLIHPAPHSFAAIAYTGVFPAFLGYIFWNRGVAEVGPQRAGLFMHLMPVFGVLLSMVFLGERLALYHLMGIGLILSGITLTVKTKRVR
ncbi:MAG: hypothetical protein RIR70_1506 [Pseudomonadota bacterium]|jgi:drug/metabolite transporter (DMT)-like permease